MALIEIAPDVYLIRSRFRFVNCYLIGDVLVDSGMPWDGGRIVRLLRGRRLRAHAVTHAHPDHLGSTRHVCRNAQLPLWCGTDDVPAAESGALELTGAPHARWILRLQRQLLFVRGQRVERTLRTGDEVAGFTVIETPGHTPGHVAFWRERDRVLICGDVMMGMSFKTFTPGLYLPIRRFTWKPEVNLRSARILSELRPRMIAFGHGPVMTDQNRMARFLEAPQEDE